MVLSIENHFYKKDEILLFLKTWMVLESIPKLSEISKTEDKYHEFTFIGILKNRCINKKQNQPINTENKPMAARGQGVGGWAKWMKGSGRHRLSVME